MAGEDRLHDNALLDALSAQKPAPFHGEVWRITARGREPLRGSAASGRWSPGGSAEVLYTSVERAGALAEVGFRLSLEPVWPSRLKHQIHRIEASTLKTLYLRGLDALQPLGVDTARYESFDYAATQAIAAAAHFLEFDSMLVRSARAETSNLVIFLDRLTEGATITLRGSEAVDWEAWRKGRAERDRPRQAARK